MAMRKTGLAAMCAALLLCGAASAADLVKAKANYTRYCAACHGLNGVSVMPDAPNLRLNQGMLQSDMQILNKLKMGSPPKKMPMMGLMSDQEFLDVITYVRTLR